MEWTLVDIGKKHVIPKSQYRRKRREFFHNEDRELKNKQQDNTHKIDDGTSHQAERQIHKDSIDKHERFKNSLSSHLEKQKHDDDKLQEVTKNNATSSKHSNDKEFNDVKDDLNQKMDSDNSKDQTFEDEKLHEKDDKVINKSKDDSQIINRSLHTDLNKNDAEQNQQQLDLSASKDDGKDFTHVGLTKFTKDNAQHTEDILSSKDDKQRNSHFDTKSEESNKASNNLEQQKDKDNQKPLTLPEEQKLKRQQSQDNLTDENQLNDFKTESVNEASSKDQDNVTKVQADESLNQKRANDTSDNLDKHQNEIKQADNDADNIKQSQVLLNTNEQNKEIKSKTQHDSHKTDAKNDFKNNKNQQVNKASSKNNKAPKYHAPKLENKNEAHNEFGGVVKKFWLMYWPKVIILIGIIVLIIILNAIFNNVNKNDRMNDSSDIDAQKYTNTMKNANNTVKSVVTVENETSKDSSLPKDKASQDEVGSGVVYKKSGDTLYIVTNAHVVGDKENQKITFANNKSVVGKVLGKDKWSDLAVVKATSSDSSVKEIAIGDSNNLVLGEPILVVGNPLGIDFKGTVTEGIISGLNRNVPIDFDKDNKYDMLMKAFQVDASVNPGNSGGAVVNREGKLIGVVAAKISMQNVENMAFAIPVNEVQKITKDLEKKGKIDYPDVGVKMKNIANLNSYERQATKLPGSIKNGVVVDQVDNKGLAEQSGLKRGDVIVELDGKLLEDDLRFRQIIFSHKDDLKSVTAKIYRDGKEKEINIKLK
ncbi:trypsin-like peptidase domain-containing protein [Staphylococcus sp. 30400_3112M30941]|nr:trypsin-like peptidase domain-containing protein [Staphylococcus sp. 30403_3112M30944]MBO0945792.1 trypsin-like peptidase domain-containing protein [Staphylococcus sp. 30402_3112M30943]MBO0963458.1 trypsin-like peptidase domain-containing protein [Staphylococcus sp. 30400_3112M30941]MBO0966624.1 trypsin-like peptidase domain-containing protein [Staphylococcus sp. 30401_3112M30942]